MSQIVLTSIVEASNNYAGFNMSLQWLAIRNSRLFTLMPSIFRLALILLKADVSLVFQDKYQFNGFCFYL